MGISKNVLGCLAVITVAAPLTITPAKEALALSKPANDFLLSISVDPGLENVKLADQEGAIKTTYDNDPVENSLESLAIAKRTNGVKNFINTRAFIRRLKADFSRTAMPRPGDLLYPYDPLYLTLEERALVARKLSAGK